MDEKKIEDFARWIQDQRNANAYAYIDFAREAARRFGMSAEDWAVLAELNSMSMSESNLVWPESLRSVVLARRKAQEPKPRFEKFEIGIRDRETDEFISPYTETGREKLLALLNQAHETERE